MEPHNVTIERFLEGVRRSYQEVDYVGSQRLAVPRMFPGEDDSLVVVIDVVVYRTRTTSTLGGHPWTQIQQRQGTLRDFEMTSDVAIEVETVVDSTAEEVPA